MVIDGEERVDQGLLAFLLVVAPDDLGSQGDLAEERQSEEDADDPAVDDQRRHRVERRVGGEDDDQPEGEDGMRNYDPIVTSFVTSLRPKNFAPGPNECSSPVAWLKM